MRYFFVHKKLSSILKQQVYIEHSDMHTFHNLVQLFFFCDNNEKIFKVCLKKLNIFHCISYLSTSKYQTVTYLMKCQQ